MEPPPERRPGVLEAVLQQALGNRAAPGRFPDPGTPPPVSPHRRQRHEPLLHEADRGTADGRRHVEHTVATLLPTLLQQHAQLCPFFFILSLLPIAVFCIYMRAWYVFIQYVVIDPSPCDQPLGKWLGCYLVYSIRGLAPRPIKDSCLRCWCCYSYGEPLPLRAKLLHLLMQWFPVVLMLYGANLVRSCETCKETSPELFTFAKWYCWFQLMCYLVFTVLGAVVLSTVFFLISRGYISTHPQQQAASQAAFEALADVPYEREAFAPEEGQDEEKVCCICLKAFGADRPIKRTPCGHFMHASCLQPWMQIARTCPICRTDLETAYQDTLERGVPEGQTAPVPA